MQNHTCTPTELRNLLQPAVDVLARHLPQRAPIAPELAAALTDIGRALSMLSHTTTPHLVIPLPDRRHRTATRAVVLGRRRPVS